MIRMISRLKMILFLLVMAALCGGYAAGADIDLTQPVWVFLPADTDPSNPSYTFATMQQAMAQLNGLTAQQANNAVIEFHGNTSETKITATPTYSVTIRSEAGKDHTVSYNSYSSEIQTYALRMSTSARTLTLGGGEGYGILTLDLSGNLAGLNVTNGNVKVQDGFVFMNGKCEEGNGGAIRIYTTDTTYSPAVYVYGGSFINNKAKLGGAICVATGKLYLYGGTFTGNTAEKGNAIYNGNTREVHISGNPVLNKGQDIYLSTNLSSDATNMTALIKDGAITSTIPVTLGDEPKNIFGFRNVMVGGTDTVVESDLEHLTIFNKDEVSAMYLELGYNVNDATKKVPVIELVTDFMSNFDNFIDNDFKPAPSEDSHGKTAKWLDETTKDQAEITIDESSSDGKTVLVIGSMCGAHGLTSECMVSVINAAAKHNNVEYWFESDTAGAKSQFDQSIAGLHRGPVYGTVEKGKTLKKTFETYSGAHIVTGSMAMELAKRLQEKRYYEILMVFDNATITDQCYKALTPEEQKACYKAANMLIPYYESNKIIWVSAGKKVMYFDYETHTGYSVDSPDSLLIKGCYSTDTSLYHYDTGHVTNNTNSYGKYDKFNTYFTMALMDPATWLKGVKEKKIPAWSEYNINTEGVLYYDVDDIINYIGNKFFRDEIVISDVVSDGLNIKEAYLESSSDGGVTWTKKTEGVKITIDGQNISCDITNITEDTNIRLNIICDCPGEFNVNKNQPKDTNKEEAIILYKKDGVEKQKYELDSPQLLKVLPKTDLIIKKSGMKQGENAVFTVTQKGETDPKYTVTIMIGKDGSGQVTLKDMLIEEYTVAETSWSWAYEKLDPKTQDISKNSTFTFVNKPKGTTPVHAEAGVNNKLEKTQGSSN